MKQRVDGRVKGGSIQALDGEGKVFKKGGTLVILSMLERHNNRRETQPLWDCVMKTKGGGRNTMRGERFGLKSEDTETKCMGGANNSPQRGTVMGTGVDG